MASPHRFTMQQEALNTDTHHRSWSHNNLRSKAVTFVRAGELQHSEFENVEHDGSVEKPVESQLDRTEDNQQSEAEVESKVAPEPGLQPEMIIEEKIEEEEQEEQPLFVIDTVGESVPDTGLPDPKIPDPDQSDDTSEDEVVFTGRNAKPIIIDESEVHIVQNIPEPAPVQRTEEVTLRTQQSQPAQKPRKPQRKRHQWSPEQDDMIADYIANMDQDYLIGEEDDRAQVEMEGGAGVSYVMGKSGSSSSSSDDEDDLLEDDEAGVEDSIDGKQDSFLANAIHAISNTNI